MLLEIGARSELLAAYFAGVGLFPGMNSLMSDEVRNLWVRKVRKPARCIIVRTCNLPVRKPTRSLHDCRCRVSSCHVPARVSRGRSTK
jgi:hypothetical protein